MILPLIILYLLYSILFPLKSIISLSKLLYYFLLIDSIFLKKNLKFDLLNVHTFYFPVNLIGFLHIFKNAIPLKIVFKDITEKRKIVALRLEN